MKTALIVVDVQNDFCPGGALAVNDGDKIVPLINMEANKYDYVVVSKDWHPADHGSFASAHEGTEPFTMGELSGKPQMLWPDHCVEDTEGAKLHPEIDFSRILSVNIKTIQKGQDKAIDSYSAFYDNNGKNDSGLNEWLKEKEVKYVFVCGLALDYCVKYTALDAASEGYTTYLLGNLTRPVDLDNVEGVIKELMDAGITLI